MPLNTSVWFLPSERPSTIEREAGVYPVSIGREQNFGEYRSSAAARRAAMEAARG